MDIIEVKHRSDFRHIYFYYNKIWTRNLPFNSTFVSVLKERINKLGIIDSYMFCYPTKIIEVMDTEKFISKIPETTRKILLAGLLALERQLERQKELYGDIEDVFDARNEKKKYLIQINRDEIYKGFRLKMHRGLLFMPTGNKVYNGDFSFRSDILDELLAHYSTFPMLIKGDFSEFDALFVEVPKDYLVRPKKKAKNKRRL